MTLHAFDGADPTFNLASAKAHGGIVCSVYIVGTPGGMAHANAARVAAIRAAGMGVLPNWERQADFFSWATIDQCRAAGVEAAAACKALGIPADMTVGVAFSFDFEVPTSRFPEMTAKLKACQAGMGATYKAVAYGQSELIEYLAAHGMPGPHWLMMSTFGRPYNASSPNVFMWQQVGGSPVASTDVSIVTHPHHVPAWWPDDSPYRPVPPVPVQPTPNTPMPAPNERPPVTDPTKRTLTDADIEAIWAHKLLREGPNGEKWYRSAADRLVDIAGVRDAVNTLLGKGK